MNTPSKKLAIAFVSDAIYPYNIGGKEKRLYEISTRLAKRGHNVTIYTMKWWKEKNNRVRYKGVWHEAISPLYPLYTNDRRSMKEAIFFSLHCFSMITKQFTLLDADHMPHLVLFPLKIVCFIKRKPLIATWNEVWGKKYWIAYLGVLGHIAAIVEQLSVHMPDTIVAVSKHTAEKLVNEFNLNKPIFTSSCGISLDAMKKIKKSSQRSDVIYTGRLLAHKNVDMLITAIMKLTKNRPDIICRIVGNGPEEARLKQLVKKYHLQQNVLFHDFFPKNDDVFALIRSAKVFVLPSEREGFGIVTVEALSLGIPVITYNHPDNAAKDLIINGTNGFLYDKKMHPLETIIEKALEKTFSHKQILGSAKQYDWEIITAQTENIYQNVINL